MSGYRTQTCTGNVGREGVREGGEEKGRESRRTEIGKKGIKTVQSFISFSYNSWLGGWKGENALPNVLRVKG